MAYRAFSSDSHIVESPEVIAPLAERFGLRAPQVVYDGAGLPVWLGFGTRMLPVGRRGLAGKDLRLPSTQQLMREGYKGLLAGATDPTARLADQDVDGVIGEVIYPSLFMALFSLRERDIVHAAFERYNDWVIDYCAENPQRLLPIACIPLPDIEVSVAELQRVADLGARGVAVPCQPPTGLPYHHSYYSPFWDAAQDVGLPISLHVHTGADWRMGHSEYIDPIESYVMGPSVAQVAIADIICGAVTERHPGLRFVIAEFDAGWLPHFLDRLDHAAYRNASMVRSLRGLPSEYFARQFWITFQDDRIAASAVGEPCMRRLMWASDYPHIDSCWPTSQTTLETLFCDAPPGTDVEGVVGRTACELYGVDGEPFE